MSVWKIYIGPSALLLTALGLFFLSTFISPLLAPYLHVIFNKVAEDSSLSGFFLNLASDLVAALILGIAYFKLGRFRLKGEIAGKYKAEIKRDEANEDWGEVDISYYLFGDKFRAVLKYDNLKVVGEAVLVKEEYLVGYYREKSLLSRRRFGSFMYQLNGDGKTISGRALTLDPTNHGSMNTEEVTWTRKD